MSKTKNNYLHTRPRKFKGATGYSLHLKRLLRANFSNRNRYRVCIKYPLVENNDDIKTLAEKIVHDYCALYGNLNLSDYENNTSQYSALDFWLDALRLGGIFQSSAAKLKYFINPKEKTHGSKYLEMLDQDNWETNLKSLPRGETLKNKEKLSKKIRSWFTKDTQEDKEIDEAVKELTNRLFEVGNDQNKQKKSIIEFFGLNEDFFEKTTNLTYFIHPDLKNTITEEPDIKHIIDLREDFFKEIGKESNVKNVQDILGLQDNFNAFSHFFGGLWLALKKGETQEIYKKMLELSPLWQGREQELKKRIETLCQKAQLLPYPKMAKHWGDYRSSLGGKLQSWSTNYFDYLEKSKEKFQSYECDIEKIKEYINEQGTGEFQDVLSAAEDCLKIIKGLKEKQNKNTDEKQDKTPDKEELDALITAIAELRSVANQAFQQNPQVFGVEKNNQEKTFDEVFKNLSNPTPKYPEFFGDTKAKKFDSYINAEKCVTQGKEFFEQLNLILDLPKNVDETSILKQLDGLLTCEHTFNTNHLKSEVKQFLTKYTSEQDLTQRSRFYINPNNPNKKQLKLLPKPNINVDEFVSEFKNFLDIVNRGFEDAINNNNYNYLIDWIEFNKRYTSFVASNSEKPVEVYQLCGDMFAEAKAYLELLNKKELSGKELTRFINSFIAPKIKGAINLKSREVFTERYTLQMVGSFKKWQLIVEPKDTKTKLQTPPACLKDTINTITTVKDVSNKLENIYKTESSKEKLKDKSKELLKTLKFLPHKFVVNIVTKESNQTKNKELVYDKESHSFVTTQSSSGYKLQIKSSPEQMQFLEMLLALPKAYINKETQENLINLEAEEPSLIVEKYSNGLKEMAKTRVFFALPFSAYPVYQNAGKIKKNKMGVDLGEYGVAYSVVTQEQGKEDKKAFKLMESGFLYEPQFRTISSEVAEIKARQLRGTFSMPSSVLANLRESAHKTVKNRLQFIALKHNAQLVYEKEVDAFETAENRVKKLYRTIKRGDVYPKQNTDKPVFEHYWGAYDKTNPAGVEVSAYGTSYFCPKCRKSIYELSHENATIEDFSKIEGYEHVYKALINPSDYSFYFYCEKEPQKDIRVLVKYGKLFARPPLESEAVKLSREHKSLVGDFSPEFIQNRGNQPLFICPFCLSCYDADIQAAINIAIKRFLYEQAGKPEKFDFYSQVKMDKVAEYPSAPL